MAGWISAALAVTGAVSLASVWLRHRRVHRAYVAIPPPPPVLVVVRTAEERPEERLRGVHSARVTAIALAARR